MLEGAPMARTACERFHKIQKMHHAVRGVSTMTQQAHSVPESKADWRLLGGGTAQPVSRYHSVVLRFRGLWKSQGWATGGR
jgi:hypothetical protein